MQSTSDQASQGNEMSVSPVASEDALCKREWLRVRDSLENILQRNEKNKAFDPNADSSAHLSAGDEKTCSEQQNNGDLNMEADEDFEVEDYVKYISPRRMKSVNFRSDVVVVSFAGDQVIDQHVEPLKKELEQQKRNKELRRGYVPASMNQNNPHLKKSASDYMAAWYKK